MRECPTLTGHLADGSTVHAAAVFSALVRRAERQDSEITNRPAVKAASRLLLRAGDDSALDRLQQVADDLHVDQRTARRYVDRGFQIIADIIAAVGTPAEAICEMTANVRSDRGRVLVHVVCMYPLGTPFETFQIWRTSAEGFTSAERLDTQVPFSTRSVPDAAVGGERTAISVALEFTKQGSTIDLTFAPEVPMTLIASLDVQHLAPNVRAAVTSMGHMMTLRITIGDSEDGAV